MSLQDTPAAQRDWLPAFAAGWPGWLQALGIVAGSVVAAMIIDWLLQRTLKRWAGLTRSSIDDRVLTLLHRPLLWTVIACGVRVGIARMHWSTGREVLLTRLVGSFILVLWGVFTLRVSGLLLKSASRQKRFTAIEERTLPIFVNAGKIVALALVVWGLTVLWDADPGPWIASAGIAGIAVGFAAQDTLSNFFAGIAIIADAPYRIGDYVNLAGGQRGRVVNIGLRSTRILTRDDVEITIPNSVIGNAAIINETQGPSTANRVRVQVGVAYGTALDHAERVLLAVAKEEALVLGAPEPRVRLRRFGESGLDLELLSWILLPESRGLALHRLNREVYRRFRDEGIEIPYPKRDLYVKQMPGAQPAGE